MFVLPSCLEGQPIAIIEAMASGVPVVGTTIGAVPDLIRDGVTGFLVADDEQAVRAVARLGEFDRRTCRAEAETRFDAQRMVDDYLALFERVVGG